MWMEMHASVHAINVNEKSFLRKDQKKDNQERLAKEELDSRDKHHKIKQAFLRERNNNHCFKRLFLYLTCVNPKCMHAFLF